MSYIIMLVFKNLVLHVVILPNVLLIARSLLHRSTIRSTLTKLMKTSRRRNQRCWLPAHGNLGKRCVYHAYLCDTDLWFCHVYFRYCKGVFPVFLLKTRIKCVVSLYPTSSETCSILIEVEDNIFFALSMRVLIKVSISLCSVFSLKTFPRYDAFILKCWAISSILVWA